MALKSSYANRFPHTCKIYRLKDETAYEDGTKEMIYEGKCAVYTSSNLRDFKTENVEKNDLALDIPELVKGIGGGCYVDCTDFNETLERRLVIKCMPVIYGKLNGTTVYFSNVRN